MTLADINVLIYAFRSESVDHRKYKRWLESEVGSDAVYGLSDLVVAGFLRIVTHPRILVPPTPPQKAVEFVESLRDRTNCVVLTPGPRHWEIFVNLCRRTKAKGNLISDAYHAALAIEGGAEWITTDRDYARFPGLRWRHPLEY